MILYRDKALNIINSGKNISKCWLIFGADEGEVRVLTQKIIDKVKSDDFILNYSVIIYYEKNI